MAKRFTENTLWEKVWFTDLSCAEKCAWFYIKDKCDPVGVWETNFKLARAYIGDDIDWETFRQKCNGNIVVLPDGKWWLVDFCDFQYGELSEESKAPPIRSYIALLKKHGLWESYLKGSDTLEIHYQNSSDTPKDKDKDKDKDISPKREKDYSDQFLEFYDKYPRKEEKKQASRTYGARIKEGAHHEDIMRALGIYLREIEIRHTEVRYIKLPSTFLNNFSDYLQPDRGSGLPGSGNGPPNTGPRLPVYDRGMLDLEEG